jgi:imidazolonepropionase-like amidohydrolase
MLRTQVIAMHIIRIVAAASFVASLLVASRPNAQDAVVAFENVSVIPMDRERVLSEQTVLVTGGRITAVGAGGQVTVPPGATRISGRGQFLIPALAEMHAHVPSAQGAAQAERVLFLYVANGIGTIRSMLGDPSHFRLRERAMRGEIVAPTMYLSGPSFNGQTAATPEAASTRVTEQKKAGYDLLKIHPGVPRTAFDALAATADKVGIRFAGHVPADVGLRRALEAKFSTIDHLDGYIEALTRSGAPGSQNFGVNLMPYVDESRIAALVAETKAAGTWNVPTQILLENWYGPDDVEAMRKWPEIRYANPGEVSQWVATKQKNMQAVPADQRQRFIALRRRLIKALNDGGAGILLGSDAPQVWNVPGFSIHRELATYVASGLTPYQALATGTRNVAVHTGTLDRTGTIESGKRADLVLLQGNPLQDISNTTRIAGVMINGRWLSKAEIDRRLTEGR